MACKVITTPREASPSDLRGRAILTSHMARLLRQDPRSTHATETDPPSSCLSEKQT